MPLVAVVSDFHAVVQRLGGVVRTRSAGACRLARGAGRAFTLIELLIVIAIIALLALIAIPNFLEAQTRARLARGMADMRVVAAALEAYALDAGRYPPPQTNQGWLFARIRLTTPVAYLAGDGACVDPFGAPSDQNVETGNFVLRRLPGFIRYYCFDGEGWNTSANEAQIAFFVLAGNGPDGERFPHVGARISRSDTNEADFFDMLGQVYAPTNGTISVGETLRFGASAPVGAARLARIVVGGG